MGWWRETIEIVKENDPAARTTLEVGFVGMLLGMFVMGKKKED